MAVSKCNCYADLGSQRVKDNPALSSVSTFRPGRETLDYLDNVMMDFFLIHFKKGSIKC